MINKIKKPELIAPAGNLEKLKTGFIFGADAAYLGVPDFSLRSRVNDFNEKGIREAVKLAHQNKKKIYITINILAHNRHLKNLPAFVKFLKLVKADAIIASDPGVIEIIKKNWPATKIHLSTQANCTNWSAVKFWEKMGVKRIVLGRETTLDEIKEIHKKCPKMELEYFVHGAMCMAYSGRCFLSKEFTGRSGNLGDCAQACRWKYRLTEVEDENRQIEIEQDKHGSYILNSRDLCLIKYLDKLAAAGISSFKIEGRAKSVYYLAVVVNAYRQALQLKNSPLSRGVDGAAKRSQTGCVCNQEEGKININNLYKDLEEKLIHRGYTTGFLLGGRGEQNIKNSHNKCAWEFCGIVLSSRAQRSEAWRSRCSEIASSAQRGFAMTKIKVHNTIKIGDKIEIVRPGLGVLKLTIEAMKNAKTGEDIAEAHGGAGGNREVIIETAEIVPEGSVLRRMIHPVK